MVNLNLLETPFYTFVNRTDLDDVALVRVCLIRLYLVCLWKYNPTLVDMASYFFVLCTNMKVYLYNYS